MLFSYGSGRQRINGNNKCRRIGAAVQCGVHHPMEHIQGFTESYWMPPSGKCLRRIALAAVMVKEFE